MKILPKSRNIGEVFNGTTYHIDFYQRDYKWEKEPVEALFNDIYDKFRLAYKEETNQSLEEIKKTTAQYPWYYLNTYVINVVEGKVYIVDGQQRLTTLTLMTNCLAHEMAKKKYKSKREKDLKSRIVDAYGDKVLMNHGKHTDAR